MIYHRSNDPDIDDRLLVEDQDIFELGIANGHGIPHPVKSFLTGNM